MTGAKIAKSWRLKLNHEFTSDYMASLSQFLCEEKASGKIIYPKDEDIFTAFNLTPFDKVKVVILGQDPYHNVGQAHGLSFSVRHGFAPPPSLQNIYKEMGSDLNSPHPGHGNLEAWAQQGILLLNNSLTVEAGKAGAHAGIGWEKFTTATITKLNTEREHLVFILWGRKAQLKGALIDPQRHMVITSAHPSPLSVYNGFFGSRPFSRANAYLARHNILPVDWSL